MSTDTTQTRPAKGKTMANAVVQAAAIIAAIVGLNIVGSRLFGRADLTEDKIYRLSDASKEAVASLPDRMTIKAYISSGLPAPLNQYGRYVRDLLDEYAAASKGKIAWEAIDPLDGSTEEKAQKKEELGRYKIQNMTLESYKDAKVEIGGNNYLGIGFQYQGEIESVPQVTSTDGLEYQITSTIKKMVAAKRKKVAFVTSEGELSPQQGLQLLSRVLQDYDTTSIQLDKPVPDDVDAIIVAGPKQPFSEAAKYNLDQALMRNKSIAFFVDGMVIESPRGMQIPGMDQPKMGRANDVALNDLLDKYGVKVREDLILDEQNTLGPVPVGGQLFLANYPTFVGVTEKEGGFPGKFPVTEHMKALILPFPSSLELSGPLKDGKVDGVTSVEVAQSSSGGRSWRQSGFFLFNPQVEPQKSNELGPFPLGYAIEGKLKTAYPSGPPAGAGDAASQAKEAIHTRLLVMGDSDMLADQSLNMQIIQQVPVYRSNLLFFVNAVDWLVHDESLIALRAKGMTARPLTVTYDGRVKTFVAANVVGIPIALILFGLGLWRVRTARRRSYTL